MNRYAVLAVAILAIASFPILRHASAFSPKSENLSARHQNSNSQAFTTKTPASPTRTKSKERIIHREPTIEETTDLLRNTIIPLVDFPPDQTIRERVADINQLILKSGIQPHELKVICHPDLNSSLRFRDKLAVRDIPIAVVLKYTCGRTIVRYRVPEGGIVELVDHSIGDPPSDNNSPPAEPPAKRPAPPLDPDDPFGPVSDTRTRRSLRRTLTQSSFPDSIPASSPFIHPH